MIKEIRERRNDQMTKSLRRDKETGSVTLQKAWVLGRNKDNFLNTGNKKKN